ncbi:MAG TPA: gliding motility-associated C-terminal domain-containing protein [Paludibacteraceae bacterium]|nr:gliding motility-associated C-terminal domain-containing protein [Paludibacteraceae bacterium]
MRRMHYLSLISLRGSKSAKVLIGKCSLFFLTAFLSLCVANTNAQNITFGSTEKINESNSSITAVDACNSIYKITIDVTDKYYFDFEILEDGEAISTSNFMNLGDSNLQFVSGNDSKKIKGGESATDRTFYLNTRNGYPYVLSIDEPSSSGIFTRITGNTTLNEGDKINFTSETCPIESYTYQWYENGKKIDNETGANLTNYTPTVPNGVYSLEISKDGSVVTKDTKITTLGTGDRFTLTNWYGVDMTGSSIKEVAGYCNSVYMITLKCTVNNSIQFAIYEGGETLGSSSLDASSYFTTKTGGQGEDGWQIASVEISKPVVYYLDARKTPYTISKTISDFDFITTKISQTKGDTIISRGQKISFAATSCSPTIEASSITYQWQKSTDGGTNWTPIAGATSSVLTDEIPDKKETIYRVVATGGNATSNSNEIKVSFLPASISVTIPEATQINGAEFEVLNYTESVTIKAEAVEMTDVSYTIQVKSFDETEWRDTTLNGENGTWTFNPKENIDIKIIGTGINAETQEEETHNASIVLRVVYRCDSNSNMDPLWSDDFGYFKDASTFVTKTIDGVETTYSGESTDSKGNTFHVMDFLSADVNNLVQGHDYAELDPLFGEFDSDNCASDNYKHYACWEGCNGIRIEDGYYAILTNPDISNCGQPAKDYWNGSDHTGNTNGGMLFVNCKEGSERTIIYEREIDINNDCENVQLLFSAFISNASIKSSNLPANVRLDIFDELGNRIHSVSSGDIMPRTTGEKWSNMTFKFKANGQKYKIQLTNNYGGGSKNYGNDILIDDISISICYPNINLITDLNNKQKKSIETCQLDTTINLYAFNESGITSYIDQPKYTFQYKKADGIWKNIDESNAITDIDHVSFELNRTDERFRGFTTFRTIVGSNNEIIERVLNGERPEVNCTQVYAIDSTFTVNFHYSGPMGPQIDTAGCVNEVMNLVGETLLPKDTKKARYAWVNAEYGTAINDKMDYSFTIEGVNKDNKVYRFYYIGYEDFSNGCPDTQIVNVKKKDVVEFNAPEKFIVCEYDSSIHLTNVDPINARFAWNLNGTIDGSQTGSTYKIPQDAPLNGTITVTGSADGYCDSTRTISYEIYKKFTLTLDLDGDVSIDSTTINEDIKKYNLCFAEEGNVDATVSYSPGTAKPSKFYWYRDNQMFAETNVNVASDTIRENGKYQYKVIATDGICYSEIEVAPSRIDSVFATKGVGIDWTPKNEEICDGESIEIEVTIKNALDEVKVYWFGDDLDGMISGEDTVITTVNSKAKLTIIPKKTNKFTETHIINVKTADKECKSGNGWVSRDIKYTIHNNIGVKIDDVPTYCLTKGDQMELTATIDSGVPTKYDWYDNNEFVTTTSTNVVSVTTTDGDHEYTVVASDDYCKSFSSKAMTTKARNPIELALSPLDSVFCEGTTIRFNASVKNALDATQVPVFWSGDSISVGKKTTGSVSSYSFEPNKSNTKTETRHITISTPDEVCANGDTVKLETSYTIHNKINVSIKVDPTYCLTNGSTIKLEAVVSTGEPTQYEWHRGDTKEMTTESNIAEITIKDGSNDYTVVASDGICDSKTSEKKSIEARNPIEIAISPLETEVCEGTTINFIAEVKNALDANSVVVNWSGNDVNEGITTTGSSSTLPIEAKKSSGNYKTETRNISISTNDNVCTENTKTSSSTAYKIHNNIEISVDAERDDNLYCLTQEEGQSITLTANVTKGEPTSYEWFKNGNSMGTINNISAPFAISYGDNVYSVKASDGICASVTSATRTIRARTKMDLKLDLDKANICEGDSIKFNAIVYNYLDNSTIVNWDANGDFLVSNTTIGDNVFNTLKTRKNSETSHSKENGLVTISAVDQVCPENKPSAEADYSVYKKMDFSIESVNEICKTAENDSIVLKVILNNGNPNRYIWSEPYRLLTDSSISVPLKEGKNTFQVTAEDGVCPDTTKYKDVEVREPVKLDVILDKSIICVNSVVNGSVDINNTHSGSYTNITWTPAGQPQPGKDCPGSSGGIISICDDDKGRPEYGKGTKEDPYRIGTADELKWFADLVNGLLKCEEKNEYACALLTNDIDLSSVCGSSIGNWKPIGDVEVNFGSGETGKSYYRGIFDGANHKINGLYIKDDTRKALCTGFFGSINGGEVKNLGIESGSVSGYAAVAGIAGGAGSSAKITNCYNKAKISGVEEHAGGICGFFTNKSEISKCYNEGDITLTSRFKVGGVAGCIEEGAKISDSYNTGNVGGSSVTRCGGITGTMSSSASITNCYSTGTVNGSSTIGSCVGYNDGGSISNCYYVNGSDSYADKKSVSEFTDGTVLSAFNTNGSWKAGSNGYPVLQQDPAGTYKDPELNDSNINREGNGSGDPVPNNGLDNLCNGTYTNIFNNLATGNNSICVTAYATDSKICPQTTNCTNVTVQDSLRLKIRQDATTLCQRSDSTQYVRMFININTGRPDQIVWSTGDTTEVKYDSTFIDNRNEDKIYFWSKYAVAPDRDSVYWAYGTDDICKNSNKIYSERIRVSNLLAVTMTAEPKNIQMGEEVTLTANTSNDNHGDFSWYNSETGELLGTTAENVFRYTIENNGIYKFYVTVDNIYCGNIDSDKKRVDVADYTIVPNIITPYNSNAKNNVFMGPKDGKPGYRVEIYNRYQQMVFEGEDGWDGTYRGQLAEPGTYFYRVFMKDGRVFKGTVEVAKF